MKKIKKFLFKILKNISAFFRNTKLHRIIPFRGKLYDFLFQKLWSDGEILEIQGSKMYINVRDKDPGMRKTFQAYALNRIHEETTTNLFKKVVKEGDVVIDLGANIGYFTLLAAKLVGPTGKVFAFEPEPKNFSYLKKNVELNNYTNVIIEQKAVSNYNGETKLFICPYDSGHHTINRPNGIEAYRLGRSGEITSIDIEVVTLDNYLRNKTDRVDVIKIDVEGAEALVFEGMKEILSKNQNIKIFLEFFPLLIEKMGSSPEDFAKYLFKNFSVYVIGHDYSMKKFNSEIIKIENYEEINYLMKEKTDHINLYLTRNSNIL
jgi:FkbM family methyltransferase